MRICIVLPGLHCVRRGAESMFENLGQQLAKDHEFEVTLIGAGPDIPNRRYRYLQANSRMRETFLAWPRVPPLRNEYRWEELFFIPGLRKVYSPSDYDCTLTCSYPFVNWWLRTGRQGRTPSHIFITQNGDWPARRLNGEYRLFGCDGLICTNPEFYRRNRCDWNAALIPNGVDVSRFSDARADRQALGIPSDAAVVLIAGALVQQKRILEGITLLRGMRDLFVLIVGDGPMRGEIARAAEEALPGRWRIISASFDSMPMIYASSHVLLHMSVDESFGNIYIEALAAGLPIVAHETELTRWIFARRPTQRSNAGSHFESRSIDSKTCNPSAWLVDTTESEQVIQALQSALVHQRSPGICCDTLVREYSWENVSRQYAEFVRKVVQDG